jgi:hypothetical protein
VGNISDISGSVNVAGGDITTYHTVTGLSAAEIKQLFDGLYTVIESNKKVSPTKKEDLKAEVKEIQTTVTEATQNNEKVDEGFLSRRFRNIARMAPDVLDFVVAMLANPLAGLGVGSRRSQRRRRKTLQSDSHLALAFLWEYQAKVTVTSGNLPADGSVRHLRRAGVVIIT